MGVSGHTERQVDKWMISIAVVLLLGIVVLAAGFFRGNKSALYAGVLVTLTGVGMGIQRLIVQGEPRRKKR